MSKAEEIIKLRDKELGKQGNWRSLWQETADLIFPREDQIYQKTYLGEDKTRKRYDSTAVLDSQDMASGLSGAMIPTGQKFFGLTINDREVLSMQGVEEYLSLATEIAHNEMFRSNFMLQLNETLRSLCVFGTGNLFSEWDSESLTLNYKDYDIAQYQILENSRGLVDTVILSIELTARQALQEFPKMPKTTKDEASKDDAKNLKFIHIVRPRTDRNPKLKDNKNMPFESIVVCTKTKEIVKEEGFEENPFSVARWMKSSSEKYGRGQGTEILSDVKILQVMKRDFIECGNKWNNPPLQVHQSVPNPVRVTPGAINRVMEMNQIAGINTSAMGNFPITKESLMDQQELIHKAFFRDIFVQLADLQGDRRTTVEIMERLREGLRRLALPVARLQSELFSPVITRSVFLLIRNGKIPTPPVELEGQTMVIEYEGQLALALKSQQARGFQMWAEFVGAMEAIFPGVKDNISADRAIRRQGRAFGVHIEDMASPEEVAAARQQRALEAQQQKAAELAAMAAEGYDKTNKAPEQGSPAGEAMEAIA